MGKRFGELGREEDGSMLVFEHRDALLEGKIHLHLRVRHDELKTGDNHMNLQTQDWVPSSQTCC